MPKLDSAIYGADDTAAANSVSAAALEAGWLGRDVADNNGDIQDTKRAQSYANVGRESLGPSDPKIPLLRSQHDAGNLENEGLNMTADVPHSAKHRSGPRTSTDEGAAVGEAPPPRAHISKPGKASGPIYSKRKS